MVVLKRVRDSVDKAVGKRGKKMSDNEIMKCLEGITNATFDEDQSPLIYMRLESAKSILDLINRQKTEIDILIRKKDSLQDEVAEQKAEIDKLIEKLECLLCHATDGRLSKHTYSFRTMELEVTDTMNRNYNEGYDDGIKEFAERLKDDCYIPYTSWTNERVVDESDIDNLVKELTEKGR